MVTASNVHIVDAAGQPMEKWPDIVLLKEISETLKLILKEDREWRAKLDQEKIDMKQVEKAAKEKMEMLFGKFKESITPLVDVGQTMNEQMKPLSDMTKREEERTKEFMKKIREGFSQN